MKLAPRTGKAAPHRTYSSFLIQGDEVEPSVWTTFFAVSPDILVEKDKRFITPTGKVSSIPGRTNVWGMSTKGIIFDDSVSAHLDYLIETLKFPRSNLAEIIEKQKGIMRFVTYWNSEGGRFKPAVPESYIAIAKNVGADFDIDTYD